MICPKNAVCADSISRTSQLLSSSAQNPVSSQIIFHILRQSDAQAFIAVLMVSRFQVTPFPAMPFLQSMAAAYAIRDPRGIFAEHKWFKKYIKESFLCHVVTFFILLV